MKLILPFFTLLSLFSAAYVIANTEATEQQNPADQLNKASDKQKSKSEAKKIPLSLSRGQLLYEHHCLKCHESNIHIRKKAKAQNVADIQSWVNKWQAHEKLNWDISEINAVTEYLLKRYYKFK